MILRILFYIALLATSANAAVPLEIRDAMARYETAFSSGRFEDAEGIFSHVLLQPISPEQEAEFSRAKTWAAIGTSVTAVTATTSILSAAVFAALQTSGGANWFAAVDLPSVLTVGLASGAGWLAVQSAKITAAEYRYIARYRRIQNLARALDAEMDRLATSPKMVEMFKRNPKSFEIHQMLWRTASEISALSVRKIKAHFNCSSILSST